MLIGDLSLGHRGGAAQPQHGGVTRLAAGQGLQAAVHLGVDPADEEGGHTGHPRQLVGPARLHQGLEAAQVGLHDVVVAVDPEDQRDVDALALTDERADGRDALLGRRHLHEQVGLVDRVVQMTGRLDGGVRVVGLGGGDLEGDVAVLAVTVVVERTQHGQRVDDVGGGHLPVRALHGVVLHQLAELFVIGVLAADGVGEDGRIRGDATHAELDQLGQLTALEPVAPQVVQPRALATDRRRDPGVGSSVVSLSSGGAPRAPPCHARASGRPRPTHPLFRARRALARSATWSAVKPNFSMTTSTGADAPKWSMPMLSSA